MVFVAVVEEPKEDVAISIMDGNGDFGSWVQFFNDTATTEIYTGESSSAASDVYKRQLERIRELSLSPKMNHRRSTNIKGQYGRRVVNSLTYFWTLAHAQIWML